MLALSAMQFTPRFSTDDKLIATGVLLSLLINLYLMPLVGNLLQKPVKEAALLAKQGGYKIIMWELYNPSFFVYSHSLAEIRAPKRGEIVLTTVKELKNLQNTTLLYSKYGIVLAKLKQ